MSRPTQPPRQASGTRPRGLVRTLTAVNVLVGLGVLAAGAFAPWPWQARVCVAIVGVGLLGNALLAAREWSCSVRWGDRVSTRGGATVVAYDRVPAYAAAWGAGWTSLVASLGTALGVAAGSVGPALVLGLPFVVLFGLVLVDSVLALSRGAEVVADRERLTVRSWSTETSLAWDDVERVGPDVAGGRAVLAVTGYTAATSWTGRRLPHVWPRGARLVPGRVEVDSRAVEPHSPWLLSVLQDWAGDPARRSEIGTADAERRLRQSA